MSASFYDLMKYARTGIASPSMTQYDKLKARAMFGGFPVNTLTGVPPISFKSDGSALTAWSISGNMTQTGTPTPTVPIMPEECGDLVETGEHAGEYAIPISCGGKTQTVYLTEPLRKIGDYADSVSSDGTVTRRIKKLVLTGEETGWAYPSVGVAILTLTSKSIKTTGTENAPISTHYIGRFSDNNGRIRVLPDTAKLNIADTVNAVDSTTWTTYLAQQYAAGTPVTVWYVLATPTTETFTAPTITPAKGANTLSIGTTLPPSEISVTGNIKEVSA